MTEKLRMAKADLETWTPIRCRVCGKVVQYMQRGGHESTARLWCGHCRTVLTTAETTADGAIALVRDDPEARDRG